MIHETLIKFKEKKKKVRFGMWTISKMIDFGYRLETIQQDINANPIKFFVTVTYLGACNALDKDLDSYNLNDFYDWLDETEGGIEGKEMQKIQKCFTESLSFGVKSTDSKKK